MNHPCFQHFECSEAATCIRKEGNTMTPEYLANFCEKQLQDKLACFNDSEVKCFTPSIKMGRRYVGFIQGDKQFMIEINVQEV